MAGIRCSFDAGEGKYLSARQGGQGQQRRHGRLREEKVAAGGVRGGLRHVLGQAITRLRLRRVVQQNPAEQMQGRVNTADAAHRIQQMQQVRLAGQHGENIVARRL